MTTENTTFTKSVHSINLDNSKLPKWKDAYYDFIFKITNGRTNTLFSLLPWGVRNWYYDHIKPIFRPQHKRLRKAIPKTWSDITSLIVNVNFEFIKSFYEDEFSHGTVNWNATEPHQKFAAWLTDAYLYITVNRPDMVKAQDAAYPELPPIDQMFEPVKETDNDKIKMYRMVDSEKSYLELYGEVDRLETLINEKDTQILKEMIDYRDFFWT